VSTFESNSTPTIDSTRADLELEVLKAVHSREDVKQRDIAEIVGVSLGMTNAILKRLSQKGLVTIKRVNNRNLRYAVSPDGMEAIARRSYRYFKRTIKNVVYYRDAIETLVHQASRDGNEHLVLVGESDLAFILEHFCEKYGMDFRAVLEEDSPAGAADATAGADGSRVFTVYGEECDVPADETEETDFIHLQHLLEG
jgi:DNA-binding MarR family transcriptional regulator